MANFRNLLDRSLFFASVATLSASAPSAWATELNPVSVGTMVGIDVGTNVAKIAADLDIKLLEKSLEETLYASPTPTPAVFTEAERQKVIQWGKDRAAAQKSGATLPLAPLDRSKLSAVVGSDIGKGMLPIKYEIDIKAFEAAFEATLAGKPTTLSTEDAAAVRAAFMQKMSAERAATGR